MRAQFYWYVSGFSLGTMLGYVQGLGFAPDLPQPAHVCAWSRELLGLRFSLGHSLGFELRFAADFPQPAQVCAWALPCLGFESGLEIRFRVMVRV